MGERRIDENPPPDADLASDWREIATAIRESNRETREMMAELNRTVKQFVVVCERILTANDQSKGRAVEALERLHPDFAKIRKEVSEKMAKARRR
jgi:hypothetical protein